MKRIILSLAVLFLAAGVLAQEPDPKFRTKIFEVHNRSVRDLSLAIRGLGSGSHGTDFSWNDEMHTITVRDFPENIAAIEEALGRLDKPMPAVPDVELKISILIGSKTALPDASLPEDLDPVIKQLRSTLRYTHFALLAANVHHTKAGQGVEGSGIAEPGVLKTTATEPILYDYQLHNIHMDTAAERPSISVERFAFSLKVPAKTAKGEQYRSVGFNTPVSIRQNEKVVIGTTTMGDRAVIVVLMANVREK